MKQLRNYRYGGNNGSNTYREEEKKQVAPPDDPAFSDAMKKYGGMAEDELIEQLLKSVRTQRANGTYNPAQMNSYVQMLKPHLSPAQCEKLQNVINIINSENV